MVFAHFPDSSVASSWPQPIPTKYGKVVPVYSTKANGKVKVYSHSFLTQALGEGSHLNYITPQYPLIIMLWRPLCQSGHSGDEKNFLPHLGIE